MKFGVSHGRAGLFNLSKVPNGVELERDFSQNQVVLEGEHRHQIAGKQGAVRLTWFRNRGKFSRFDDAVALAQATGSPIDPALTRRPMTRAGMAVNAEQDISASLGLFLRAGSSDGAIETYDFTDIDRTLALGAALKGKVWGRPDDGLAIAGVVNQISPAHQRFLAEGGLGVLIGDGKLPNPGDEQVIEATYTVHPAAWGSVTLDYQHITNPGYNRDRGPVSVFAMRYHAGF